MEKSQAETLVRALYRGILKRDPDAGGLATHAGLLVAGKPLEQVVALFVESAEFTKKSGERLFVAPGHYYSPIVAHAEAERYFRRRSMPRSLPGIALDHAAMTATWDAMLPLFKSMPFRRDARAPYRYRFDNPSYGVGDGSVLHAMLRLNRPKRIIEVGSGWTSACTLDTVDHFLGGKCELTFIEPYPDLLLSLIGKDRARVRLLNSPVQDVALATVDVLEANDVLFIDSTHVVKTGSDVCFELFELLPRLKSGVLVHFHDIAWPFEYPANWVLEENRSWNETYALRAFLYRNPDWRIVFFNSYFATWEKDRIERDYPEFMNNPGGAIWLVRQ